jgi:hypothetical protein
VRALQFIFEFAAFFGIITLLVFVPLTKMIVGAILTVVGAFMPGQLAKSEKGQGSLKLLGTDISFVGSLRMGVVVAGLVVLVFATTETATNVASVNNQAGALAETKHGDDFETALTDRSARATLLAKETVEKDRSLYLNLYMKQCVKKTATLEKIAEFASYKSDWKDVCDKLRQGLGINKVSAYIATYMGGPK